MNKVQLTQWNEEWLVDVDGQDRFVYKRLTDAIRRANDVISQSTPARQFPTVSWEFTDGFMKEALAIAQERADLARREKEMAGKTNEAIVKLAKEGLSNNDIAAVLGITSARVSQIVQDTAEWLWGADDPNGELQLVKLRFGKGWRAGKGRGPLPPTLEYGGETFVPSGGATAIGGQPWKHTYVPRES